MTKLVLPKGACQVALDDEISVDAGRFRVGSAFYSTLVLPRGEHNADWWARQNVSLDDYEEQHVARKLDPDHEALYKLFGAYVAAAALKSKASRPLVLDVGCGMFTSPSPAFAGLSDSCAYVGLDPLPKQLERTYPFVCGRLEDLAALPNLRSRFNLFTFGTSLDHLEDLASAAAAVRHLAADDALLVCWNGLQEGERIFSKNGAALFQELTRLERKSVLLALAGYVGYGVVRLPRLLYRMRQRRGLVAQGKVGDHHSRWFTEANSSRYLSVFGEVIHAVTLPNTNNAFATVRVRR